MKNITHKINTDSSIWDELDAKVTFGARGHMHRASIASVKPFIRALLYSQLYIENISFFKRFNDPLDSRSKKR